ncbi:SPFH domain-containing protein [uncultured Sphaerochaeta sp.]|uniref:SPFH domain-containing protein n=1 Tax=uncultured Sphaerochaeta sp. TaxID=886478 RepID=UPI002A0A3BB8|nr:SPFH domain-containing protein [uncultured Sphaerochaeta sp.]
MNPAIIIAIGIAVFVLLSLLMGLKIIPQAQTMVVERLGKYHRTLNSGVTVIWPFLDKARAIPWRIGLSSQDGQKLSRVINTKWIDLREQVYDYPKQNVITKDNVNVEIDALLYFQITDPMKAVYEIANLPMAIEKLTQTALRNVLGELELDQSLTSRDTVNAKLTQILDEATDKWGVKVNRVELQDINPPKEIREQMEKQMRAERDRRAAILIAEGQKQAQILEAEGFKESAIKRAEGEAEARIKRATAEAEAVKLLKQVFGSDDTYTQYLVAMRYIDTLGEMVKGKDNKVIYMPYEATAVLSSLGGIKELLK